jgi:hypothetical protein
MFAFSQIEPNTTGRVDRMYVPLDRYFYAALDQGWHDSVFNTMRRADEFYLERGPDGGPMLDADEANMRFSAPGLVHKSPIRLNQAQLLRDRKIAENERNFLLANGTTSGWRWTGAFAAQTVASMANPLDFALTMMPFVGEEKLAAQAAKIGLATWRQRLAMGLISQEAIGGRFPGFTASVLNGAVGMGAVELPRQFLARYNREDPGSAIENIAMGAAFGGGMHLAIAGVRRLWRRLRPAVQEQMVRKALNDILQDKDIEVHPMAKVQEEHIMEMVRKEAEIELKDRISKIDKEELKKAILVVYDDELKLAAARWIPHEPANEFDTPVMAEGLLHAQAEEEILNKLGEADLNPEEGTFEFGFTTKKGRFVSREEAEKLSGLTAQTSGPGLDAFDLHEAQQRGYTASPEEEQELFRQGHSSEKVREILMESDSERRQERILKQEHVKQALDDMYQRRVQQIIEEEAQKNSPENQKARFEELKEQMSQEDVDKFSPETIEDTDPAIDDQIAELEEFLGLNKPEKPSNDPEWDRIVAYADSGLLGKVVTKLDHAIDALSIKRGKTNIDPLLIEMLGKPLLRLLLIAVREALIASKNLPKAIDEGISWLKKHFEGTQNLKTLHEDAEIVKRYIRAAEELKESGRAVELHKRLQQINSEISTQEKQFGLGEELSKAVNKVLNKKLDRRGFIGLLSKLAGAAQLELNPANILTKSTSITKNAVSLPAISIRTMQMASRITSVLRGSDPFRFDSPGYRDIRSTFEEAIRSSDEYKKQYAQLSDEEVKEAINYDLWAANSSDTVWLTGAYSQDALEKAATGEADLTPYKADLASMRTVAAVTDHLIKDPVTFERYGSVYGTKTYLDYEAVPISEIGKILKVDIEHGNKLLEMFNSSDLVEAVDLVHSNLSKKQFDEIYMSASKLSHARLLRNAASDELFRLKQGKTSPVEGKIPIWGVKGPEYETVRGVTVFDTPEQAITALENKISQLRGEETALRKTVNDFLNSVKEQGPLDLAKVRQILTDALTKEPDPLKAIDLAVECMVKKMI